MLDCQNALLRLAWSSKITSVRFQSFYTLPYSPNRTSRFFRGGARISRFLDVDDPAPTGGGKIALEIEHVSCVCPLYEWRGSYP